MQFQNLPGKPHVCFGYCRNKWYDKLYFGEKHRRFWTSVLRPKPLFNRLSLEGLQITTIFGICQEKHMSLLVITGTIVDNCCILTRILWTWSMRWFDYSMFLSKAVVKRCSKVSCVCRFRLVFTSSPNTNLCTSNNIAFWCSIGVVLLHLSPHYVPRTSNLREPKVPAAFRRQASRRQVAIY